jgi:hypothetical protein
MERKLISAFTWCIHTGFIRRNIQSSLGRWYLGQPNIFSTFQLNAEVGESFKLQSNTKTCAWVGGNQFYWVSDVPLFTERNLIRVNIKKRRDEAVIYVCSIAWVFLQRFSFHLETHSIAFVSKSADSILTFTIDKCRFLDISSFLPDQFEILLHRLIKSEVFVALHGVWNKERQGIA